MAMLDYNEITLKKVILHDNEPWIVTASHVFRKQQRKPVNITKLKNLISGRVVEVTFHQNESVEEAEIEFSKVKFLYESKGEYWFCDPENPRDRYALPHDMLGDSIRFVTSNTILDAMVFDGRVIGVQIPIKIELRVKEAEPAVKGDTSSGAMKDVVLETGAKVKVPLFINEGDLIRVNTEEGAYTERVEKV